MYLVDLLAAMPAQGPGAQWIRLRDDLWLWQPLAPTLPNTPSTREHLLAADFAPITSTSIQAIALLAAQFADLRWLAAAEADDQRGVPDAVVWALREDQEHARQTPVVLAFTWPQEVAQYASLVNGTPSSSVLAIAQPLPPPTLGQVALVAHGTEWEPMTLAQAGAGAAGHQQAIAASLLALSGSAGWPLYRELLRACLADGEYERRRSALRAAQRLADDAAASRIMEERRLLEGAHTEALALRQLAARMQSRSRQPDDVGWWAAHIETLNASARQLATCYWQAHQHFETGAGLTRSIPPIPNLFPHADATAPIPTIPIVEAVLAAYSHAQSGVLITGQQTATGWHADEAGLPSFTYQQPSGQATVQIRPDEHERDLVTRDTVIQALWDQVVRKFSDLDGDVFLALLAQAISAPPGEEATPASGTASRVNGRPTWISGGLLLDYRGVTPVTKVHGAGGVRQRHGHRVEDLSEVADCVGRMRNTWVTTRQAIVPASPSGKRGGRRSSKVLQLQSPLIVIHDRILQNEVEDETGASLRSRPSYPIAWHYSLGSWITPYLETPNREMALLVQRVLRYDPYRRSWEKRLGRYFLLHLRIHGRGGSISIVRRLGALLGDLSLFDAQRELADETREKHPERIRARFEQAMEQLVIDHLIDQWSYEPAEATLPSRKWLYTWLTEVDVRVSISTTADSIGTTAPTLPPHLPADRGATLRALRETLADLE